MARPRKYESRPTTNAGRNPDWTPKFWQSFLNFFDRVKDDPELELSDLERHLQNLVVVDLGGEIEFTTDGFHLWVRDSDEEIVTEYLDRIGCDTYSLDTVEHDWLGRNCCYIWGSI